MNYVGKITTLPKEEATKSIIDALNSKAFDNLNDIAVDESLGKFHEFAVRAGTTQVNLLDKLHDFKTKIKSKISSSDKEGNDKKSLGHKIDDFKDRAIMAQVNLGDNIHDLKVKAREKVTSLLPKSSK